MAITTTGIEETKHKFAELAVHLRRVTPGAVTDVLKRTERQQKTLLSMGAHRRGTPTGSVAPAPPWRISGALRDSVTADRVHQLGPDRWTGQVGPSNHTPYGRIQELGGWTGRHHRTYLPARPSLKPAWKIVRPTAGRVFRTAWADATREVLST